VGGESADFYFTKDIEMIILNKMIKNQKQYVIGVDGGGAKTEAVLANLKGKILAIS